VAKQPKKTSKADTAAAARQEASDAAARAVVRDRYAEGVHQRVIALLKALEQDVVARMSAFDPQDASGRLKRLDRLKKEAAEEIARRYETMAKESSGELRELAADEARWKATSLSRAWSSVGITAQPALAPTAILEAVIDKPNVLGRPAAEWWKQAGETTAGRFAQAMQIGVAGGEGIGELIARVRGRKANGYKDGVMSVSRREAEAVVRTSVTSVANSAQMAVMQQNADVVQGLRHWSILDRRTTVTCMGRHGLVWRLSDRSPVGHGLTFQQTPIHWRCRSLLASVLDLEEETPAELTFDTWFSGLSVERQEELFGVGRARLWREGRISQADLLSPTGRALSLRELMRSHPPARTAEVAVAAAAPVFANRADLLASPDVAAAATAFGVTPDVLADRLEQMLGERGAALAGQLRARVQAGYGRVELSISGGPIESMQRDFRRDRNGSWSVYHALLTIDRAAQGTGLAASIMRGSLATYKSLGVREISVTANIDVGGYTWARFGFSPRNPADFIWHMKDEARRRLGDPADIALVNDLLTSHANPKTLPQALSQLVNSRGDKIGKSVMLGSSWKGYVDLTDPSQLATFERAIAAP
jgi:SPP1 gp7 family putative phage head morphogenesis protein